MSTESCKALHAALAGEIRRFIASTILFHQKMAERVGLHMTDMQCVNLLDLNGPMTPGKLSEDLGLSTGGVTVMLDRLEKAGFVKRVANPQDRRSVLIEPNAKKLQKIRGLYEKLDRRFDDFLSQFPESELRGVTDFLRRMNALKRE